MEWARLYIVGASWPKYVVSLALLDPDLDTPGEHVWHFSQSSN